MHNVPVSYAATLIVVLFGGLLYGAALLLTALRWRLTRPMRCSRCAHQIAARQGNRCVECGSDITSARARWFEPRWIRNLQLSVGVLGLAVAIVGGYSWLNRPVLALTLDSRVRLEREDGTTAELTCIIEQRAEADGSNASRAERVSYVFAGAGEEVVRFWITWRGGALRLDAKDGAGPATESTVAELLVGSGRVEAGGEAAYFSQAAMLHAQELVSGQRAPLHTAVQQLGEELLETAPRVAGTGSTQLPSGVIVRESQTARVCALVAGVLCAGPLLAAAFVRRPLPAADVPAEATSDSSG